MKNLCASAPLRLKKYPAYKESGVEWLENIPVDWKVKRLKYAASCNDEVLPESTDSDYMIQYVDISSVDITNGIANIEEMTFEKAPSRARRKVQDGDTIISTVRTYLKAIASITSPPSNLIVSTGFAVIRPKTEAHSQYLAYQLKSQEFVDAVVANSEGVSYPAINASRLIELTIVLPPGDKQQSIASFLDRKTTEIDALIAKKRRMIELLQEKRTAVISHAVTKGLDPNAPMKDSGVEWLGKVPRHWEILRLKFTLSQQLQYGANESAEGDDSTLPRFIRITDIDDSGRLRDDTFKSLPEDLAKPFLLEHGDLLLARSGATVGKTFLYGRHWGRAAFAGYLIRARFNKKVALPEFVHYFTRSSNYWDWLSSSFIQATIQNVSAEKYANIILPIPTLNEQRSIVKFIDGETTRITTLIAKVNNAIDKLLEYRTALISAAVTGKIDVRDEVRA